MHSFILRLILSQRNHHSHLTPRVARTNRRVKISFPSDVRRTQTEDIAVLAPGQQVAMPFELVVAGLGGKSSLYMLILDVISLWFYVQHQDVMF